MFLLAPPAPNLMLEKLTLALSVSFLDFLRVLLAPPAPNFMCLVQRCAELSMCFAGSAGAKLVSVLLAPPPPNLMLKKLGLALRVSK